MYGFYWAVATKSFLKLKNSNHNPVPRNLPVDWYLWISNALQKTWEAYLKGFVESLDCAELRPFFQKLSVIFMRLFSQTKLPAILKISTVS